MNTENAEQAGNDGEEWLTLFNAAPERCAPALMELYAWHDSRMSIHKNIYIEHKRDAFMCGVRGAPKFHCITSNRLIYRGSVAYHTLCMEVINAAE